MVSSRAVPLTFVAGSSRDVFNPELASVIDTELRKRFALPAAESEEPYHSDEVDGRGWAALQERVPEIAGIDAYQAVFIPAQSDCVVEIPLPHVADPLHVCSIDMLMDALQQFAKRASLPTDDVELMQLAAHFLEGDDPNADLDVQTYVQLMLTAKQAAVHRQPLWLYAS